MSVYACLSVGVRMWVCMYVCMHVCMDVNVSMYCMYVSVCLDFMYGTVGMYRMHFGGRRYLRPQRVWVWMYVNVRVYVLTHVRMCVSLRMYVCIYVNLYVNV